MNIEQGKRNYDAIPIPDELEATVSRALRRGKRRRAIQRCSGSLAAMLALVLLLANVPVLYTQASELPVLGQMVRILRIGSGGSCEGLAAGSVFSSEAGVNLRFETENGAVDVPLFSAARHTAPERAVLRLHQIRTLETEKLLSALRQQTAVADAYTMAVPEPDEIAISILLQPGYDCMIGEYGEPTVLRIGFAETEAGAEEDVWYLCGPELEYGQELAELTETLCWEGASQVKTESGAYCLVLGSYAARERAERAAAGIAKKYGIQLEPRCGGPYKIP